jgi:hypothetical protein
VLRQARTKAVVLSGTGREKGEFRFANERQERDEPVDLPNPLPSRRAIN